MGGDVTRKTFEARKKFVGVRMQQGRVQPDADSNETQAILDYLGRHSQARDTLEWIVQWWLLEQSPRAASARVKKALDQLIRDGLVKCTRRANGQTYYSLKRRKGSAALKRRGSHPKWKRRKE